MTKKNIPKLRFPGCKNDRHSYVFGNIYSFRTTNSFSRDNLNYYKGVIKNIHYGDIHTKFNTFFDISKEIVPFINSDIKLDKISYENYCQKGDLVIADASEDYKDIGKSIEIMNTNDEKILSGLHTFLARPNKGLLISGFGGYLMQNKGVRKQIMRIAQGTKVLGISMSRLAKIFIIIPDITEQEKIFNFLNLVDRKINLLGEQYAKFEIYKKGLIQKIFNHSIKFSNNDSKKNNTWQSLSLGKILIEKDEKTIENKQYQVISSTIRGLYLQSEYFKKVIASSDSTGYKILKRDQIVFSPQNLWLGNINYNDKYELGIVSPSYKIFEINSKYMYSPYFKYIMKSSRMIYEYMHASEQGASIVRRNLNMDLFNTIKIELPSIDEQREIYKLLKGIDNKINSIQSRVDKAKEWKKGLLQKMFI